MIVNFRADADQIENIVNEVQDNDEMTVSIAYLGLLKRALYAMELANGLCNICLRSAKIQSDKDLADHVAEELNVFLLKSEETEVTSL